jgi:hypothetical protein
VHTEGVLSFGPGVTRKEVTVEVRSTTPRTLALTLALALALATTTSLITTTSLTTTR